MTLLIYVENVMIIIVITCNCYCKKNYNECVCITGKYSEFCEKIIIF